MRRDATRCAVALYDATRCVRRAVAESCVELLDMLHACFNQYWYDAEEPQKTASLEVAVNGRYLLEDSYGISG